MISKNPDRGYRTALPVRESLLQFQDRFQLDLVIAENALTIPMHIPLGLATTDWLSETKIPAIAHHHDFYWERERFQGEGVLPLLKYAFPPSNF